MKDSTIQPQQWLTKRQAAEQLQCSIRTIDNLLNRGVIPKYRLHAGAMVRIKASDLDKAIERVEGV